MGTFFEDWSGKTVQSGTPAGYTALMSTNYSRSIVNEATAPAGKAFSMAAGGDSNNATHRVAFTADALSAITGDYEVTALVRVLNRENVNTLNLYMPGAGARLGPNAGIMSSARFIYSTLEESRRVYGWDGTAAFTAANSTFAWTYNVNYWLRIKVDGQRVRTKIWAASGAEPGTWDHDVANETRMAASGVPGILHIVGNGQQQLVLAWGVGWDGDAAPITASVGGTPLAMPTGFSFLASAGPQLTGSWAAVANAATYEYEVQRWTGSAWVAFAAASVTAPTTTFTVTTSVAYSTLYRARVRAVPAA
jgi:hypothetical protein